MGLRERCLWLANFMCSNFELVMIMFEVVSWIEGMVASGSGFVFCDGIFLSPDDPFWGTEEQAGKLDLSWAPNVTECGSDENGLWTTKSSRIGATDDYMFCHTKAPKAVLVIGLGPIIITFVVILMLGRLMWPYKFGTVGYVLATTNIKKSRCYKYAFYLILFAMTGILAGGFALMVNAGAEPFKKGVRSHVTSYLLMFLLLRSFFAPADTPTPVGAKAFDLKLPAMKWHTYPSSFLEFIEDGLLEMAHAKLKGQSDAGHRILTAKLGMSVEDAEALFAAMEPQEGHVWSTRAFSTAQVRVVAVVAANAIRG